MNEWQPIETAPKNGTEVLAWREDAWVFIVKWTCPDEFLTEEESEVLDEDTLFSDDWFCTDFVAGGRLDDDLAPTHWMPLPKPPEFK